jgi:hypothetical protein
MTSLLVPGVETVHPRATWEDPNLPVNDPPAYTAPKQNWSLITNGSAHYTADENLPDGDFGEFITDIPKYLRNIQHAYRNDPKRKYSIGYLWAVDWLGGAWELRGWDYRAAANAGTLTGSNANHWTIPVLYLVDGADRLTDLAARTAQLIYYEAGRRAGRSLGRPLPHKQLDPTACPGAGISLDITKGRLDPRPPDQEEEDDMAKPELRRVEHSTATLIIDGQFATWIKKGASIDPAIADGLIKDNRIEAGGKDIALAALGVLTLMGSEGEYSVEPGRDIRVTAADFAGQIV